MLEYGFPFKKYKDGERAIRRCGWASSGATGSGRSKPSIFRVGETSYTLSVPNKSVSHLQGRPSSDVEKSAPRLGLSGNYWSPTGVGFLLLIGGICLFLSLALLAQLVLFWGRSRMDQAES